MGARSGLRVTKRDNQDAGSVFSDDVSEVSDSHSGFGGQLQSTSMVGQDGSGSGASKKMAPPPP